MCTYSWIFQYFLKHEGLKKLIARKWAEGEYYETIKFDIADFTDANILN